MVSGFDMPNASREFTNLVIAEIVWANWFKLTAPTMSGSKVAAPKCCLLVYIDDVTGRLMNLRFSETESAFDYMVATREYLEQHGKPTAFYSDRHAIFHVSKRDARTERLTQFGRVFNGLNIELICANSTQAKGRVERAKKRYSITFHISIPSQY